MMTCRPARALGQSNDVGQHSMFWTESDGTREHRYC
jgi:hypothetical protein